MSKFEVGKQYYAYQKEYGYITILRRTEKTIWVKNDTGIEWYMRIKHDNIGNEFVVDSCVEPKWRDSFTYSSDEVKNDNN